MLEVSPSCIHRIGEAEHFPETSSGTEPFNRQSKQCETMTDFSMGKTEGSAFEREERWQIRLLLSIQSSCLKETVIVPLAFFVPYDGRSLNTRYENDEHLRGATCTRPSRCILKDPTLESSPYHVSNSRKIVYQRRTVSVKCNFGVISTQNAIGLLYRLGIFAS